MKNETEEGSVTNNNEGSFNGTNIEDGNKKSDLGIKKEKKQMDKNAKIYFVHKNAREGYCNISKI